MRCKTDLEGESRLLACALAVGKARPPIYIPGCARHNWRIGETAVTVPALVLFDGTVWEDDEMIRSECWPARPGRVWGIWRCTDRADRSGGLFPIWTSTRKVYVHMNNTNPVLDPGKPRKTRGRRGVRAGLIGEDGMELEAMSGVATREGLRGPRLRRDRGRCATTTSTPFTHCLHSGGCTPDQVRAWVINRYYYQCSGSP